MRRLWGIVLLLALVGAAPLGAQFWQKKPYTEWSKKDCEKMLRDSPWARSRTVGTAVIRRMDESIGITGRTTSNPEVTYVAQLLSARPIRQALVRQAQHDPRMAELPAAQRAAFEQWQRQLLETEYADTVMVQILYNTNTPSYTPDLMRYYQARSQEELLRAFNLIGKPGRLGPLRVQVGPTGTQEIQLIFPRYFQGQPVVTEDDKTLAIEFIHPAVGELDAERILIEFKVKDMMLDGSLVF